MCSPSDFFDNVYAIIGTEIFMFGALSTLIIIRLSNKKSFDKDLERIETFLDKIDEETLIKLCEIEQRTGDRRDSIQYNVDQILESKHYIQKNKKSRDINKHMKKIDEGFLNIFKSSIAIKSRQQDLLDRDKNELINKIDSIIRERDRNI